MYHGCRALTFALARLSCFRRGRGHVPEEDVNQYDDIEYQINHRKWTICRTHKHTVTISVLCDLVASRSLKAKTEKKKRLLRIVQKQCILVTV